MKIWSMNCCTSRMTKRRKSCLKIPMSQWLEADTKWKLNKTNMPLPTMGCKRETLSQKAIWMWGILIQCQQLPKDLLDKRLLIMEFKPKARRLPEANQTRLLSITFLSIPLTTITMSISATVCPPIQNKISEADTKEETTTSTKLVRSNNINRFRWRLSLLIKALSQFFFNRQFSSGLALAVLTLRLSGGLV